MKLVIFLILLIPFELFAQKQPVIEGTYLQRPCLDGDCYLITFQDHKFKMHDGGHLGGSWGEGYFFVDNKNLTFFFDDIKDPDTSTFSIKYNEEKADNFPCITLSVYDLLNNQPFNSADITFLHGDSLLARFFTDSLGMSSMMLKSKFFITSVRICAIGYHCVEIPTRSLNRSKIEINVILKPVIKNYMPGGRKSFEILSLSKTEIKLKWLNNKVVSFKRE